MIIGLWMIIFLKLPYQLIADQWNWTCDFFKNETGFRCQFDDYCIPLKWACDGENQCIYPDMSDEQIGCDLFNETGCKSWNGKKHIKCPDGKCILEGGSCVDKIFESSTCPEENFEQWRCLSGRCIPKFLVCDNIKHCNDGSDESVGCNLYPEEKCKSWHGEKLVHCNSSDNKVVCSNPKYQDDCRVCDLEEFWRCDDGFCIKSNLIHNGIKDCPDGSDEITHIFQWFNIVNMMVITLTFVVLGLILSCGYRILKYRFDKSFLDCIFCQSKRAKKMREEKDVLDMSIDSIPYDRILPTKLIDQLNIDKLEQNNSSKNFYALNDLRCQSSYAKVHQDTLLYKNFYRYLVYRCSTPSSLRFYVEKLWHWEKELHQLNHVDSLSCWRLHIGSDRILKKLIDSVQPESCYDKFNDWYFPIKNANRKQIRKIFPKNLQSLTKQLYMWWNLVWFLIKPLIGATFLYFDILKDIVLVVLLFESAKDVTENLFSTEYLYEVTLIFGMFFFIIANQISFIFIVYNTSQILFCNRKCLSSVWKRLLFSVTTFFFMPAFCLANHVYYLRQEYEAKRNLQTCDDNNWNRKIKMFNLIEDARTNSILHRKVYSYFRISTAALQSFNSIVVMVVILVTYSQPGIDFPLIEVVTQKIADFLCIDTENSILAHLDLIKDVSFLSLIFYSAIMIITALTRYIYQYKSLNLHFSGRIFLCLFFICFLILRLTMFIAIYSSAKSTSSENLTRIDIKLAVVIGLFIYLSHFFFIWIFKTLYVINFKDITFVEKIIHILANTMAPIPFSKSSEMFSIPSKCKETIIEEKSNLRRSCNTETKRVTRELCGKSQNEEMLEKNELEIENKKKVLKFWWEDPERRIEFQDISDKFRDNTISKEELLSLEMSSLVNIDLFFPQKTKREYFWLMFFHLFFNILAFIIEVVNNGLSTSTGNYYSWDVRISSLFIGIIFLLLYYRKYHVLRDITSQSNFCNLEYLQIICCKKKQPQLKAMPDLEKLEALIKHKEESDTQS